MLVHRLKRRPNINPPSGESMLYAMSATSLGRIKRAEPDSEPYSCHDAGYLASCCS